MERDEGTATEIEALRDRLSRLSEASLRITEDLDFSAVLQSVLDSARSLTGARYGAINLYDDAGAVGDFLSTGSTVHGEDQLWTRSDWQTCFKYLSQIPGPLRVSDLFSYINSLGLAEASLQATVGPGVSFLASPVLHQGERVGNIYLAEKESEQEFTVEDEETLILFASQAAMAIANARRYREEQRARADLETLIDTSPVGVALFDAKTGAPLVVQP